MQRLILLPIVLVTTWLSAQTTNVFLDRDFWKGQPTIETIAAKIKEGNSPSEFNAYQFDAVVYAILEKVPTETVKYLLTVPENSIHKITHDGRTYLFWAAYAGDVTLMEYLVAQGARVDLLDEHGNTPLIFAASNGQLNTEVYDVLIKAGSSVTDEKSRAGANALLLMAPFVSELGQLSYFTTKGLKLSDTDEQGNGIFNYAARNGKTDILDALIAAGVPYKNPNKENGNAILFACQGSRSVSNGVPVFEYLVSKGIDPTITTTDGTNALHILAGRCKDPEVVRYFLKMETDVNAADAEGNTPLMIAAASQHNMEILRLILEQTKDINHANQEGMTALAMAVQYNQPDVIQLLAAKNADFMLKDKAGNSLVYYLIESYRPGKTDEFESKLTLLRKKELQLNGTQANGNTPLHLAVLHNDRTLVERVLSFGPMDINAKNGDGLTVLHIAAMKATDDRMLKFLLEKGADRTILTDFEESAYDLASENELLHAAQTDLNFLK